MPTVLEKTGEDIQLLTGSEVMAEICRLVDVDVITAYPIRPYDTVMQYVSKSIANGDFDADFIVAESEHGQFEIVKHASACGARVFTGSSGVGWFYAMEPLAVTAGLRLPMVALVGCRALDDPGAFGTEHNDALAVRDLGWLINFPDTAQETIELGLMSYRVAEDPKVFLPCAIAMDGAFLTHSQATVRLPGPEKVNEFLPPYDRGDLLLHPDNPITIAPQANEDWLMEVRRQSSEAGKNACTVLKDAYKDFNRIFGENVDPFLDEYMTDDADIVLCGMGTLSLPVRGCHPRDAKGGEKGRLRPAQVVPPLPDRGAARLPLAIQGGGRGRPRLLVRLPFPRRHSVQRDKGGPLRFGKHAPHERVHLRPRRPGGPAGKRKIHGGFGWQYRQERKIRQRSHLDRREGVKHEPNRRIQHRDARASPDGEGE